MATTWPTRCCSAAAVLGLELRIATPESHRPARLVRKRAEELAAASGARLSWSKDPVEAVRGADFVYTDVWTSMGQEAEHDLRLALFQPYQVNAELMRHAPDAWVLHCLPAHRGEEITDDVLDGERSIVFDQAENRLHAQKAILERLLLPRRKRSWSGCSFASRPESPTRLHDLAARPARRGGPRGSVMSAAVILSARRQD